MKILTDIFLMSGNLCIFCQDIVSRQNEEHQLENVSDTELLVSPVLSINKNSIRNSIFNFARFPTVLLI